MADKCGQVAGKVALVTGGASGIGEACTLTLAREGASVVVTDIDEARGKELVEKIAADGGKAIFLKQDVTELKTTTRKMELDLARMDGRVSQMPTLLQLITVVVAIWGMAFATLRFTGVH